jgi:hypothetical protein
VNAFERALAGNGAASGPNEFVPIPKIAECATIYALTAAEMLR